VRRYCRKHGRPFTTSYTTRFPEYISARTALPEAWTYAWLRRFHAAAAVTMVSTPSLTAELASRGFSNLGMWTRGVNTELFRPERAIDLGLPRPIFISVGRIAIEKNLAKTRLEGRVRQQDVFAFLKRATYPEDFQIIFADPPYEKTESGERFTAKLLADESLPHLLGPQGIFVLEKMPSERLPQTSLWRVSRGKTYGATEVLFLQHASDRSASEFDK